MRSLSYSEISCAASCGAQWDFKYGGRLAGNALKNRQIAPRLSDGRAWGAALAAWHSLRAVEGPVSASIAAADAATASYRDDREAMAEMGFRPSLSDLVQGRERMDAILEHYFSTVELLPNLTQLEGEINIPLWSRSGKGWSNRYGFQCFIDGWVDQHLGESWIVEFKLRDSLQDVEQILLSRQLRWYAWALRELQRSQGLDFDVVGVLVDERLKEAPKLPRLVQGRKKSDPPLVPSHAKDQLCTADAYLDLCEEHGVEPKPETVEQLKARRWQQRIPIQFRDGELDEAGRELVSAAKLIHQLDSGEIFPIRNARPGNCRSCDYRRICANPQDAFYVDTLFERRPAKRDR